MAQIADLATLPDRLAVWLSERYGRPTVVEGLDVPEGVGHSNETVVFRARAEGRSGPPERLVVRLEAGGPGVFPSYDLGLQVTCLRAIEVTGAAPVPHVRWYEPDRSVLGRPFYVMDAVDGQVPTDMLPYTLGGWLNEADPGDQRRLWLDALDVLAALHRIDVADAGLDVLDRPTHGPAGPAQQLSSWVEFDRWAADGRPSPAVDAGREWLHAHLPADPPPVGLNWGDARLSNMMFRDFAAVAVLDWEMAALGPAEVDLAWFLFFQRFFSDGLGVADLPGFPAREASVDHYAAALGRDVVDLEWYEVFAAWRHSAIMGRLADLFEARGDIPAGTDARVNNIASRMLAAMIGEPPPGEPGGPFG